MNFSNVLGRGLNGDVVTAVNRATGVSFALKTYRNLPSTNTFTNMRYCARECEILKKITHPNIARLHQVYEEDAGVHMVLELYTGVVFATCGILVRGLPGGRDSV